MKRVTEAVGWGSFLFVAGVFLLLKNLGVFREWGELIWGALFAVAGLGFLIWFIFGPAHWWRAIPAFTLLGIGGGIIMSWRNIELGAWSAALVLFGMALGFWAILLVRREHWWSLVPAGVLTTVGVLLGLWDQLSQMGRLAILFTGIGVMFLLLYAIRYDEHDARWASVPAGALLLLGVVTLINALSLPAWLVSWWPIALVIGGLLLVILGFAARRPAPLAPAVVPEVGTFEDMPPAPGASVVTDLPPVEAPLVTEPHVIPPPAPAAPAAPEGDIDIYEVIKEQPPEE